MGALLVYDTTDSDSFYRIKDYLDELQEYADEKVKIALVANKIDMKFKRQVDLEEGRMFAKANGLMFAEVSAESGVGLEELFQQLLTSVLGEKKFEKDFRKSRELSVKVHSVEGSETAGKRGRDCC